ncbi:type II toxin-antitoxin system RelE/ParE family toxin [Myroides marinus]|uniref:type II toxin-antitoxin system RelE/ParE family toxin n=1 Tax=Myroides marinus TaxID=703342 RepID=UPI002576B412|nr:type II toxin-antitoxin system RelE/ParE family toxin [Myroides marinus]MDM1404950.1 type II toxin-antitoxin system RelE/ParE family toxin [Myroides marinus]
MKIVWSEYALSRLKIIYDYYVNYVGVVKAEEVSNLIVLRVDDLLSFPYLGQIEYCSKSREQNMRYILIYQYKIVYEIVQEDIIILDVFHTKQSPHKMCLNEEPSEYVIKRNI